MTTTDATYRKEICYDRETRDYAMYLDGELVGFERTYHQAEVTLDNLVFELMSGQHFADLTPAEVQQDIRQTEADTEEADVLLSQTASHPGPDCSCPDCTRAAERLIVDAYITRLQVDAGLICQFCGDDHADTTCPQRRSLLAPRVCGNCGGQHSIEQCSDIRRLLFAA